MTFNIRRKRLREMGVPEDMTADDVVAFFSLPDDDDSMHMQSVGPTKPRESWYCEACAVEVYDRRCPHCGKLKSEKR
jgi:hypothetical protein